MITSIAGIEMITTIAAGIEMTSTIAADIEMISTTVGIEMILSKADIENMQAIIGTGPEIGRIAIGVTEIAPISFHQGTHMGARYPRTGPTDIQSHHHHMGAKYPRLTGQTDIQYYHHHHHMAVAADQAPVSPPFCPHHDNRPRMVQTPIIRRTPIQDAPHRLSTLGPGRSHHLRLHHRHRRRLHLTMEKSLWIQYPCLCPNWVQESCTKRPNSISELSLDL